MTKNIINGLKKDDKIKKMVEEQGWNQAFENTQSILQHINVNWKDIKDGAQDIMTSWDDKTFYNLGGDFANLIFSSISVDSDDVQQNASDPYASIY